MADANERFSGEWHGKEVNPKRVYSGHRFTDAEIVKLLNDEEIEIDCVSSRTGDPYKCVGKLADQTFNGNEFVGFLRTAYVNNPEPVKWCRYHFTDEEKEALLKGEDLELHNKFIGRSGRKFSAVIRWNSQYNCIETVEFLHD